MGRQIVHDDEVAGHQGGDQAALDIGAEDLPGHGAVDDKGRGHGVGAQTGTKVVVFQ